MSVSEARRPFQAIGMVRREVRKRYAIPGEVKHLSNRRKRKRIDSVSSGERKRKSPNRRLVSGVVGPRRGIPMDR